MIYSYQHSNQAIFGTFHKFKYITDLYSYHFILPYKREKLGKNVRAFKKIRVVNPTFGRWGLYSLFYFLTWICFPNRELEYSNFQFGRNN